MKTRVAPCRPFISILQRVVASGSRRDKLLRADLHGLLDGQRQLTRLAVTESDPAGTIAHYRQRGEAKLPTALDHLGHAVNSNKLLEIRSSLLPESP